MIKRIIILRGLPGSGKSTLARAIADRDPQAVRSVSIDHFFERLGKWDPRLMPDAILDQQRKAYCLASESDVDTIIVDNTHKAHSEYDWARGFALRVGASLEVRTINPDDFTDEELAARCTHNVPVHAIARMRAAWEK